MASPKSSISLVSLDPPVVNYRSGREDLLLHNGVAASLVAPGLTSLPQQAAAASLPLSQPAAGGAAVATVAPSPSTSLSVAPATTSASAPAAPATATSTSTSTATTTTTSTSDPVIALSLQTNGQGSGKKSAVPPPPPATPELILRGPEPWSDERVASLIAEGKVQADWLPDIRATALTHLQIQNQQQREMLRFSNAIANTGANNWQVRRGTLLTDPEQIKYAESLGLDPSELAITSQELLDADGNIAVKIPDAALSEFHPEHKHFHIGETAEFGVDHFNPDTSTWDRITGLEVVKTTFCLIDVNQIRQVGDGDPDHYETIKSPANANVYNDCFADVQGIQDGWIDRYHHSLQGQEVDITNLPAGTYRVISTVNPAGWFMESDFSNNVGWTSFDLSRDSNGNAKLRLTGEHGGVWFDSSSNGMG